MPSRLDDDAEVALNEHYGASEADDVLAGPLLRQIGSHLRLAREERGQELHEVADVLRIRRIYLQNLEDGELAKVPGRTYALGFLRSYADYLGFDGEAIVDEVKRANEQLPESPELHIREPLPESQRPPLVLVGVSLVLAVAVYVGWTYWQERGAADVQAALEIVEPSPSGAADSVVVDEAVETADEAAVAGPEQRVTASTMPALPAIPTPPRNERDNFAADDAEAVPFEADEAAAEAAIDAIIEGDEAPTEDAEASSEDAADDAAGVEPLAMLALIETASGGATPRPFGSEEGPGRVVLVATQTSWVQVRSIDREFVWTRTMEPGDAFYVPDQEGMALWTGNAGGLKVIVDGEPMPELGDPGEVRRDILLAVDSLRAQYAGN